MLGASLTAAETVKKKGETRQHVGPSGKVYKSDHDLTPAERKQIDAYDLSQQGSVKLGAKADPNIKTEKQPSGGLFAKTGTATKEGLAEAEKYAASKGVNLKAGQSSAMQRKAIGNIASAKAADLIEPVTGPASDFLANLATWIDPLAGFAEKKKPGSVKGAAKSMIEGVVTGPIQSATSAGVFLDPTATWAERGLSGAELARDALLATTHITLPKVGGALKKIFKGAEKAAVLEKGAFVPKEDPGYFSPGTLADSNIKVKVSKGKPVSEPSVTAPKATPTETVKPTQGQKEPLTLVHLTNPEAKQGIISGGFNTKSFGRTSKRLGMKYEQDPRGISFVVADGPVDKAQWSKLRGESADAVYAQPSFTKPLDIPSWEFDVQWKRRLHEQYGTNGDGALLTKKLKADGYDAIITRDAKGNIEEVVALDLAKVKPIADYPDLAAKYGKKESAVSTQGMTGNEPPIASEPVANTGRKTVRVYRGTAEANKPLKGGEFFTDNPKEASNYADLSSLRRYLDDNNDASDLVNEILNEEGMDDITDMGLKEVRQVLEANGFNPPKTKGHVSELDIEVNNPLDLRDLGNEIKSVEKTWRELHQRGLVDEGWDDLDEFAKEELIEEFKNKASYKLFEQEGVYERAFNKGHDSVIFKDQGLGGMTAHDSYILKNAPSPTPNTPKPIEAPQKPVQSPETASVEGPKATGISHAEVDKIREEVGWTPRESTTKSDAQLIADSKKHAGKESTIADRVLNEADKTLSDEEGIALLQRLDKLRNEAKAAKKADNLDAYETADLEGQKLAEALDESGSRQGRDFRARRFMTDLQSDPWFVVGKLRKKGVSEKKLAIIKKNLEDAHAKISDQEKLIADLQKAATEADARDILTKTARAKRQVNREAIIKEIDDLWKELPAATAKLSSGIDPDSLKVFGKLVVRHIELGAATVDDAIRTVIEEAAKRGHNVSNLDIFEGVRQNAGQPATKTEAQALIAKNKAELTRISKQYVDGAAMPTKEAKRMADIEAINADLENQIKTGQFKTKDKAVRVRSRRLELEEQNLKQLRAEVQGIIKAAEPKSIMGKVNEFAREAMLANPFARIVDVTANTAKMASYVATNPARSLLSSIVTPKTIGRERFLFTPSKLRNVFENAPARWKGELKGVLKGYDFETIEKYGHPGGWFSRMAGASDVVFKDVYARLAYDDYALGVAKSLGLKGKELESFRNDAFKQLVRESAGGPLKPEDILIGRATAQDWAARQTFNIDNMASGAITGLKENWGARLDKAYGRNAGDSWRLAMDSVFRFSKVIGNVALERFNYTGAGIPEAVIRGIGAKTKHGMIPVKDARLISDLATKGLVGLATIEAGKQAYDWIKAQPWIKGEIKETEGGTKFVKWTLLEDVAGGLDAEQLGGIFTPMLYGATQQMIEESNLTEKQKDQLWSSYAQGQIMNQPLSSGLKNLADIADPKGKSAAQIGANLAARSVIPSGVNEIGQRMDKMRNGVELRKATTPMEEFIKRLPIYRESLPSNEKKISR